MNLDGMPDEEDIEVHNRYGPWESVESVEPVALQRLMEGFPQPWWLRDAVDKYDAGHPWGGRLARA